MTIRFANTDDIPQLLNLLRQVERVHHDIRPDLFRDGGEKYEPETLKELLKDVNRPVLAAVEDGVVVGYAFCVLEETAGDPARLDRKELYLDDLCVDASVRGKGVAKQLWQETVDLAKQLGCDAVTLNVWEGNDRARKFYENCGLTVRKTFLEYPL
ncbi:GNAT family N-acetyltransferase [Pseudoflavonifractor sp. MSJ-30]|uniref:GNAT family N-acetyltransferase n=1 Tax=Pseudoflavonifractor sp. MSJ-30 TaxID=2841525 RepID=UPI001C1193D1|nr:GNAT family N-acetyltransferase [Pseudoflavonifractor sp. MSJ-30]MBU5451625.1 GNAT family N-acetyltransferase [Pseudoflavonifractor sp. MSJ-30]